jgi:peptide chain release factor 1
MAETNTAESKEALLLAKWEATARRYDELTRQLTEPSVLSQPDQVRKLNKERTDLEEVAHLFTDYQALLRHLDEAEQMLKDAGADAGVKGLATEEVRTLQDRRRQMEERAMELLVRKDPRDDKNTFVEIRAGAGGEEAALFAGDLLRMYTRYAERKRLKTELMEADETGIGGYKNVVLLVEGKGAYGRLA